jgi:hypothetical protein
MPRPSKKSKTAKLKRQSARTAFGKHSRRAPSPESSDYCVSDNRSDDSIMCLGSTINRQEIDSESKEEGQDVEASVEGVQLLYSVFLPPHLRRGGKMQVMRLKTRASAARSATGHLCTLEIQRQRDGERRLHAKKQQRDVRPLIHILWARCVFLSQ